MMAETVDESDKRGRAPDYIIKAMSRDGQLKQRVGAAWLNAEGSISLKLDAFVVLNGQNDPIITLFKKDR